MTVTIVLCKTHVSKSIQSLGFVSNRETYGATYIIATKVIQHFQLLTSVPQW